MNRLGLFKRAAGLVASPALLASPPSWRALTPTEPSIPEPPMTPGFVSHGHVSYPMPYNAAAGHTHSADATHTHWAAHTHCLCHGHCGCRW